jgi:diguanylate cyclase (GGDEF)-like protein
MIAQDLRLFIFPDDLPVLEDLEASKPPKGTAYTHARLRLVRKDQTSVWISINARCVRNPATGEPFRYVLCMRDITGRTALEEKLSALALTDSLTGLWNRRAFDQALRREWKRTLREESQLSLLLLDLDHFKRLNDQYGHALGDDCLVAVASAITDSVRASDFVCRWGGDEIAIILPATDHAGALKVAEKVRSAVEALRFRAEDHAEEWASVTVSIGMAAAVREADEATAIPQNLLRVADKALYRAKQDGRNRVAVVRDLPAREPDATVTPAIAEGSQMQLLQEQAELRQRDGLVREGPPNGIDGL